MDQPEKDCGESSTNELPVTLQNERSSERLATGEAPIEETVDHEPNIQTNHLISAALKTDIKKMFKRNMTAEEIMIEISGMRQHSVPEISQIKTCLRALRRANLENKMINLKELKAWIDLNKNVPDNPQDVFIISDNVDEEDAEFLFALSSKSLIEIAKDAGIIHIDSRYKLMWQGFPAYVVGTTDRARKFHPLCLAVTSRELKDDFKLIFAGLQNQVQELFHVAWKAHVLVCNSTHAIQRAFVEVFGNTAQVRTCWNEVYRKMSGVLHNKNVYTKLFTDLNTLQSLSRPNTFIKASEAFVEKYQDLAQFVKKFKKLCLENRNWYVGAVPMSPDTNGALQTFVRKQTIQPHLNQCDFLTYAKELIKQWSSKYVMEPEENFFSKLAPITTWDWMNAYNWAKIPKEVTELNSSESHFKVYSVPSGEWTNFRGFQYHADKFKCLIKNNNINWIIKIPVTAENWQQGTCDCPAFPEKYTCKHVIGMAIRLRHVIAPLEARVYARPARQRKPYYNPRCHCRDTLDSDSDENEF